MLNDLLHKALCRFTIVVNGSSNAVGIDPVVRMRNRLPRSANFLQAYPVRFL
jgi:hypothetical protein